jgi:hypothetical protein
VLKKKLKLHESKEDLPRSNLRKGEKIVLEDRLVIIIIPFNPHSPGCNWNETLYYKLPTIQSTIQPPSLKKQKNENSIHRTWEPTYKHLAKKIKLQI